MLKESLGYAKILQGLEPGVLKEVDNDTTYLLTVENILIIRKTLTQSIFTKFIYSLDKDGKLQVQEYSIKLPRKSRGTLLENTIELFLQERLEQPEQKTKTEEKSSSAGIMEHAYFQPIYNILAHVFPIGDFEYGFRGQLNALNGKLAGVSNIKHRLRVLLRAVKDQETSAIISAIGPLDEQEKKLFLLLVKSSGKYNIVAVDVSSRVTFYMVDVKDFYRFKEVIYLHIDKLENARERLGWYSLIRQLEKSIRPQPALPDNEIAGGVVAVRNVKDGKKMPLVAGGDPQINSLLVYILQSHNRSLAQAQIRIAAKSICEAAKDFPSGECLASAIDIGENAALALFRPTDEEIEDASNFPVTGVVFDKYDTGRLRWRHAIDITDINRLSDILHSIYLTEDETSAWAMFIKQTPRSFKSSSAGVNVNSFAGELNRISDFYREGLGRARVIEQVNLLHEKIRCEGRDLQKFVNGGYVINPIGELQEAASLIGPFDYKHDTKIALMVMKVGGNYHLLAIDNENNLYNVSVRSAHILEGIITQAIDSGLFSQQAADTWRGYLKANSDKTHPIKIDTSNHEITILRASSFYLEMMRQNQAQLIEELGELAFQVSQNGGMRVAEIKNFISANLKELDSDTFKNMGLYDGDKGRSDIYSIKASSTEQTFLISRKLSISEIAPVASFGITPAENRIAVVSTHNKTSSAGALKTRSILLDMRLRASIASSA
ncbi:MAG: hypothetical protein ABH843_05150 [Candidatus Omnitrophota bacterium]